MRVKKAVLTAAAPYQRRMPLQTLIDADGVEKPLLRILLEEILAASIEEVAVITHPGDEEAYTEAIGPLARGVRFLPQPEPRGYAHAVHCAASFTGSDPFLHLVGDHVYISGNHSATAKQLVTLAEAENCPVSAVTPTRENQITRYGAVAGPRLSSRQNVYRVETVLEKPTPTQAEQQLTVSGLRAGFYLCYFGMHVLTPTVMDVLGRQLHEGGKVTLSSALAEIARREQYLALEAAGSRYDAGARYGLLTAQMALALSGKDRDFVLSQMLELLAQRQLETA